MTRSYLGCAVACSALVVMSGCSFIFARPTPTRDPGTETPQCSGGFAPLLDVFGAVGLGVGAVFLDGITDAAGECGRYPCDTHLWFYVPAAVLGASAIYGAWANGHCSSELGKDKHAAALAALDHAIEARCGAQSERPKDGVAASGRPSACGH